MLEDIREGRMKEKWACISFVGIVAAAYDLPLYM